MSENFGGELPHASFHDGRVVLFPGDCLEVLKALPENSVDAVVTDPPYHLTSIVKRFGAENAAPCKEGKTGAYARASRGFMGKVWDGGDIAFRPELWAEVLRVLKPGGHMVCFGGTRTYHRMTCAIEDAGFEVRDQLAWVYGSGFPKSHDVSKGIDKNHHADKIEWFGKWLREERARRGLSQKALAESGGFYDKINHGGLVANWELGYGLPSATEFNKVCDILGVHFERIEELEREIIGTRKVNAGLAFTSEGPTELDVTAPATDAARQWQGWGTALKPAFEPVCLARKPLSESTVASNGVAEQVPGYADTGSAARFFASFPTELSPEMESACLARKPLSESTVVANVLRWGTGALNIDRCRIESEGGKEREGEASQDRRYTENGSTNFAATPGPRGGSPLGRWPPNLCHDGSPEVLAGFPERDGAVSNSRTPKGNAVYGEQNEMPLTLGRGDSGSAARFFYHAKANKKDRAGSSHPTVKPIALISWLIRLVTPPGGTVLDPFAGTGTTAAAAFQEGARCVLIEREQEYREDIVRRVEALKIEEPKPIKVKRAPKPKAPDIAPPDLFSAGHA